MKLYSGGHLAQLRLYETTKNICSAEAITYEDEEEGTRFLNTLLGQGDLKDAIFFVHWGPHVPKLIHLLSDKNIVYISYSTGYNFQIPPSIPIIAGSKHTQAYWGRNAPNSPIFYLPCEISEEFKNLHLARDVDVLVQKRKSSRYLLEELIPNLRPHCSVKVLDSWVDSLAEEFNRSKIYLYDSTDYWIQHGVSEGFGLPPLEAIACGCTVFSSVNDALSDYLDPGVNCHKIRVYSKQFDTACILKAIDDWEEQPTEKDLAIEYRKQNIEKRLKVILHQLNVFFDFKQNHFADIEAIVTHASNQEIEVLRVRIQQMEDSLGWRVLQRLRRIYHKAIHVFRPLN